MTRMIGTTVHDGTNKGAGPALSKAKELRTGVEKHDPLPTGGVRRGLSRREAAAYVGVSPTLFDRAVVEGKMPKPFRLYGRVLWDIRKLDVAITALDTEDAADDPWGRMAL
jgi:predicted DNA-binding transcriptional regulator AlpA